MNTGKDTLKADIFQRSSEYLLLNASFNDKIGLCNGKSALTLFLYYLNTGKGFSFLEEIIEQINESTPDSFGSGTAGFGTVLEHLVQAEFIDEDANEILEHCEKAIFNNVYNNSLADIGIAEGITGIGLFLLHRLQSRYPNRNALFFNHRVKEGVARCVFAIERKFVAYRLGDVDYPKDPSFWDSPCSALLLLTAARSHEIPAPRLALVTEEIIRYVTAQLTQATFSWNQIDSWFVLLHAAKKLDDKEVYTSLISSFKKVLQVATSKLETIDFYHSAFSALLLHLVYKEHGLAPALHLSDNIVKIVHKVLSKNVLPDIFPFNPTSKWINIGLDRGVCGTALSLWSLENKNFRWMSIMGINY